MRVKSPLISKGVLDAGCAEEVVIANLGLRCLSRKSGEFIAITALD